jgi:hypothetical protein
LGINAKGFLYLWDFILELNTIVPAFSSATTKINEACFDDVLLRESSEGDFFLHLPTAPYLHDNQIVKHGFSDASHPIFISIFFKKKFEKRLDNIVMCVYLCNRFFGVIFLTVGC